MKRTMKLATLLALPALLMGCEGDDEPLALAEDCTDLAGSAFVATDFGFTSVADAAVVRDFDAIGSEFRLTFDRTNVVSDFRETATATPFTVTSPFTVTATGLTLGNDVLIPGAEPNVTRTFVCTFENDVLRLRSEDVGFDFDDDEIFEDAVFEATFDVI